MKNKHKILFIFSMVAGIICAPEAYAQRIRFNLGGAKFTTAGGELNVSISVDTLTPTVITGTVADQIFRDDSVGAAFFGYYLTAGVRTQGQAPGTVGNLKVRRSVGETTGRTYYLLGNGTTTPTLESHLTVASSTYTTIASVPRNRTRCGPQWSANGVSGNGVNCGPNPTVANMDITQFIKVLFADPPIAPIISKLSFVIVQE